MPSLIVQTATCSEIEHESMCKNSRAETNFINLSRKPFTTRRIQSKLGKADDISIGIKIRNTRAYCGRSEESRSRKTKQMDDGSDTAGYD